MMNKRVIHMAKAGYHCNKLNNSYRNKKNLSISTQFSTTQENQTEKNLSRFS